MTPTTPIAAALLLVAGGFAGTSIAAEGAAAPVSVQEKKDDADKKSDTVTYWVLDAAGKG